jgi:serine/threonine protein kinase
LSDLSPRLVAALASRYAIERELGHGGMATVYLAQDLKHHRSVAVKVLRPELTLAVGPDRFLREIEIAAHFVHPHIVPVFDSGEADCFLYYVMPYVVGESLRSRLTRESQLPIEDAVEIACEVASALAYAHSQGIVHRDIKPENILLGEGHAIVADFGIARAITAAASTTNDGVTGPGLALGTPLYMSPEQSAGQLRLDGRADIYSLGCVLYEMLVGEPPFVGPTPQAVAWRHAEDAPAPLRRRRSHVPAQLEYAIMKSLAKLPADRFASATEFAAMLHPALIATIPAGTDERSSAKKATIVVLPFENLSPENDIDYLSDGLTDEILTDLSSIKALGVISRTSAMQLKNSTKDLRTIGRELNVQYALEGGVRKVGSDLRITTKLVDTRNDELLWVNKFKGTLGDVFEIQETIARNVVAALELQLSSAEDAKLAERPIPDIHAYEYYLRARQEIFRFTGDALERALQYLQKGVEILGDNIMLQSAIGYTNWQFVNAGISGDRVYLDKARDCAARILSQDPASAHGHRLLGLIGIHGGLTQDVVKHLRYALKQDPNDTDALLWLSLVLGFAGRAATAKPLVARLLAIDPLTAFYQMLPGFLALMEGDFGNAVGPFQKSCEMDLSNPIVRLTYGQTLAMNGQTDKAIEAFDLLMRDMPNTLFAHLGIFYKLALTGRQTAAMQVVPDEMKAAAWEDMEYSWCMAQCYALAGESSEALRWLANAISQNFMNYPLLAHQDPLLASLRGTPEFDRLMVRVKMNWQAFEG